MKSLTTEGKYMGRITPNLISVFAVFQFIVSFFILLFFFFFFLFSWFLVNGFHLFRWSSISCLLQRSIYDNNRNNCVSTLLSWYLFFGQKRFFSFLVYTYTILPNSLRSPHHPTFLLQKQRKARRWNEKRKTAVTLRWRKTRTIKKMKTNPVVYLQLFSWKNRAENGFEVGEKLTGTYERMWVLCRKVFSFLFFVILFWILVT